MLGTCIAEAKIARGKSAYEVRAAESKMATIGGRARPGDRTGKDERPRAREEPGTDWVREELVRSPGKLGHWLF